MGIAIVNRKNRCDFGALRLAEPKVHTNTSEENSEQCQGNMKSVGLPGFV